MILEIDSESSNTRVSMIRYYLKSIFASTFRREFFFLNPLSKEVLLEGEKSLG